MLKYKNRKMKRTFRADLASGMEAVAFAMSICAQVVKIGNQRVKFKFPFWAFSVPAGSRHGAEWIDAAGFKKGSDRVLYFIQKPGGLAYFQGIKRQIISEGRALEKSAQKLRPQFSSLSDIQLISAYKKFMKQYSWAYGLGILTFLYESILSDRLMISLLKRDPRAIRHLPVLMQSPYVSFMILSEEALARIRLVRNSAKRESLIKKYSHDFFYIRTNYWQAPEADRKFILERIQEPALKKEVNHNNFRRIKLQPWESAVINLLKISEAIHDKRKQINIIGSYIMFRFLDEAVKRRRLKLNLAKRAFWQEYPDLLLRPEKILSRLKTRSAFSVGYSKGSVFYLDYIAITDRPKKNNPDQIIGTPASGGIYRGTVCKVMAKPDFKRFKEGNILVAAMTRPDFLPIMKKAGAIVTDEGGLACHAAIISRELGLPCIIGTKIATKALQNGDFVEVNANHGVVKILKNNNYVQ